MLPSVNRLAVPTKSRFSTGTSSVLWSTRSAVHRLVYGTLTYARTTGVVLTSFERECARSRSPQSVGGQFSSLVIEVRSIRQRANSARTLYFVATRTVLRSNANDWRSEGPTRGAWEKECRVFWEPGVAAGQGRHYRCRHTSKHAQIWSDTNPSCSWIY